jgi:4-hydroxy-tetrahydrodipicolinate synthase
MLSASQASWLVGYMPELPTPFDEAGALDLSSLTKLCERLAEAGVPAIVVGGAAGEASSLSLDEYETVVGTAVDVTHGRIRVIAGLGSNATSEAIELTRRAEAAGADSILIEAPRITPKAAGVYAHLGGIANVTKLPIILRQIPPNCEFIDEALTRLSKSGRVIGLVDGTSNTARCVRLRRLMPAGFRLLSGDDASALAYFACLGDGCISMAATVAPELCQAIFSTCKAGLLQSARHLQQRIAPLTTCLAKESPATLKYALYLLGFVHPCTRLPTAEPTDSAKAAVERAIAVAMRTVPVLPGRTSASQKRNALS